MSDAQNWRTETDAGDYFGNQKKKLTVADRRPVIRRASDLVGPGIAASAVPITDFNDLLATYNGFYSAVEASVNAPNADEAFIGYVVMDDALGGRQVFTGLDTGSEYNRIFLRNPGDPSSITWGAWVAVGLGLTFVGCKAVRSTAQSITASTPTAVSFTNSDEYDTSAIHDTSTDPSRLTIPADMGGQWRVSGQVLWASDSATLREARVRKNGTELPLYLIGDRRTAQSGSTAFGGFSQPLTVDAGDYLEMFVEQHTSGALDVQASFAIERLS